jgi:hypothetical protein
MSISADKLMESAMQHGVDAVTIYTPENLDPVFFNCFIKPDLPARGFGYWRWKPYIIMCALQNLKEGDKLIYSDAGCTIVNNVHPLVNAMDSDIMLFTNGFEHSHWCKGDIMKYVNGGHTIGYKQCQASLILFKKTDNAMNFVKEWYAYSLMPGLIDDSPSTFPNAPEFAENRHDQSILTALRIKYNMQVHWFPSTTNHHQTEGETRYKEILFHHRYRNEDW